MKAQPEGAARSKKAKAKKKLGIAKSKNALVAKGEPKDQDMRPAVPTAAVGRPSSGSSKEMEAYASKRFKKMRKG